MEIVFFSATAVTKIAVGIIQLWFHYFLGILACNCPREAKQRDGLVVGLFTPVFLFVYEDDQFANLSVPFKNAIARFENLGDLDETLQLGGSDWHSTFCKS